MKELEQYIFYYFSSLLTVHEKAAWKSINTEFKIRDDEGTQYATVLRQRWVSTNPNVVALLSEGSEKFFENATKRVIEESGDQICFNHCPKCKALARTPTAKQCAKCFYSWHEQSTDQTE